MLRRFSTIFPPSSRVLLSTTNVGASLLFVSRAFKSTTKNTTRTAIFTPFCYDARYPPRNTDSNREQQQADDYDQYQQQGYSTGCDETDRLMSAFAVLALEPTVDANLIKQAFRTRAMQTHPDAVGGGAGATMTKQQQSEEFNQLRSALEVCLVWARNHNRTNNSKGSSSSATIDLEIPTLLKNRRRVVGAVRRRDEAGRFKIFKSHAKLVERVLCHALKKKNNDDTNSNKSFLPPQPDNSTYSVSDLTTILEMSEFIQISLNSDQYQRRISLASLVQQRFLLSAAEVTPTCEKLVAALLSGKRQQHQEGVAAFLRDTFIPALQEEIDARAEKLKETQMVETERAARRVFDVLAAEQRRLKRCKHSSPQRLELTEPIREQLRGIIGWIPPTSILWTNNGNSSSGSKHATTTAITKRKAQPEDFVLGSSVAAFLRQRGHERYAEIVDLFCVEAQGDAFSRNDWVFDGVVQTLIDLSAEEEKEQLQRTVDRDIQESRAGDVLERLPRDTGAWRRVKRFATK